MRPEDIPDAIAILSDEQKNSFNKQLKQAVYKQLHKKKCLTGEQLRVLLNLCSKGADML